MVSLLRRLGVSVETDDEERGVNDGGRGGVCIFEVGGGWRVLIARDLGRRVWFECKVKDELGVRVGREASCQVVLLGEICACMGNNGSIAHIEESTPSPHCMWSCRSCCCLGCMHAQCSCTRLHRRTITGKDENARNPSALLPLDIISL